MKNTTLFLWFISCLLFETLACCAEDNGQKTYVIVHKKTKEVYTVSGRNDTVVPEGYEVVMLPRKIESGDFPVSPNLCYYDNGRFKPNMKKINQVNSGRREWDRHVDDFKTAQKSAREKFKALGFTKAEIDAIFREGDYHDHKDGERDSDIPTPSYVDIIEKGDITKK